MHGHETKRILRANFPKVKEKKEKYLEYYKYLEVL